MPGLDAERSPDECRENIDDRGDLPPLAATLNKVQKSELPGGRRRAFVLHGAGQWIRARTANGES
jgi:hypothetical protein